jgi:chromosome segregation ATPase
MRDGKLYKELGYQNFEDYCENEIGFSRMQAHRMISIADNLPKDFVTSMLQIGTTKLSLLAKLDEPERQEIIQNNDLENTSVKELKNKISDLKKANDRLLEKASQAEKNAEDSRKKESEAWGKVSVLKTDSEMQIQKISQLEKQIQELENNPKQVAIEDTTKINELKEEIKKLKADSACEINNMKTRHDTEKADFMRQKNELKKQLEEIEKDRQDWIDTNRENVELTQKISQLEKQIQELENRPVEVAVRDDSEEVERLKKQLEQERQKVKVREIPDNSELFEVYYQNCMDSIDKLFAFMINTDGSEKFMDKIYELSDYINGKIEDID